MIFSEHSIWPLTASANSFIKKSIENLLVPNDPEQAKQLISVIRRGIDPQLQEDIVATGRVK